MKKIFLAFVMIGAVVLWMAQCVCAAEGQDQVYVILISIDGLRPDAVTKLGEQGVPNIYRLMKEGAFTLNARTDPDKTVTMPNHTCMLTGRGVMGEQGHNFINNRSPDLSLHTNKGSYVASVFDVVKDHGLTTAMFASKLKFKVFVNSYADAKDPQRPSKMDVYGLTDQNDGDTVNNLLKQLKDKPAVFTFVHFAGPDQSGHAKGWDLTMGSRYMSVIQQVDVYLGKILEAIDNIPFMKGATVILLTSDHGGIHDDHDQVKRMENYRIPFIIWGKGVARGMDLYKMNKDIRRDPGARQVPYGQGKQPIRNGDAANIVCSVLGLPLVPGSTIGNPDVIKVN